MKKRRREKLGIVGGAEQKEDHRKITPAETKRKVSSLEERGNVKD
jgi:hypothetical protein